MQVPPGVFTRVIRLLEGRAGAPDLDRLFLWLRERPYGKELVRDIGDFAAHWAERKIGIAHRQAGLLWDAMDAHVAITVYKNASVDVVARGMRAAYALDDPAAVKQETGIAYKKMKIAVTSAIAKLEDFDPVANVAYGDFTPEESAAIGRYVGRMQPKARFTDEDLVDQLAELLLKFGILNQTHIPALKQETELLGAYAIAKMHGATISAADRPSLHLHIGLGMQPWNGLGIYAQREIQSRIVVAIPLFVSHCRAEEWCTPDLSDSAILVDIEFADGKLRPVY